MASTLHHPWLDVPPWTPMNEQEAVELADLAQALVPDDVDPGHLTYSAMLAHWRDTTAPGWCRRLGRRLRRKLLSVTVHFTTSAV